MQKYSIGILLFDEVEVLDFAGPFEVFSAVSQISPVKFFEIFTISRGGMGITTKNGLQVLPDYGFDNHPQFSIIIIPGGDGARKVIQKPEYISWIKKVHETNIITASVCTGALILAKAGLLDGLPATTHHLILDDLKRISPSVILEKEKRYVDTGKVITSGGVSAGIDMSLFIVRKLFGEKLAFQAAKYMEYGDWREPHQKPGRW